jgi:hypothetical protein
MNDYLLVGTRLPGMKELSPDVVARCVATSCLWQRALLRWGLLRSFAVGSGAPAEPTVCLVVHASSPGAADDLAVGWERAAGYLVTTLPLVDAGPADEDRSSRAGTAPE